MCVAAALSIRHGVVRHVFALLEAPQLWLWSSQWVTPLQPPPAHTSTHKQPERKDGVRKIERMCVIERDVVVEVREEQNRKKLDVSTWLVIQSDYHRLMAPTGRHPRLLSSLSPLPLQSMRAWKRDTCLCVCECEWDRERWLSRGRQIDTTLPPHQ